MQRKCYGFPVKCKAKYKENAKEFQAKYKAKDKGNANGLVGKYKANYKKVLRIFTRNAK